ncbi:hypothetical protein ACPCSG_04530 [Streptomyces cellulosae]
MRGYDQDRFWENGWPTNAVCDCCGNESGIGDTTVCPSCGAESGIDDLGTPGEWDALTGIRTRRGYWAAVGAPWAVPAARPTEWDVLEQLARLPHGWR